MKHIRAVARFFFCITILQTPFYSLASNCPVLINSDLLNELKLMCEKDQEARLKVINLKNSKQEDHNSIVEKIDQEHLPRLKNIILHFGWPGFKLVGEEGADYIWLLTQHCDQDAEFQKLCLDLLKEAVTRNDAPKRHLAYLTDRVLVNEGKAQIYGTQATIIEGQVIILPIQEFEDLDKRREEMGLCPLAEYRSLLKEIYHLEK